MRAAPARDHVDAETNNAVPEALTELLESCTCDICQRPIGRFEMSAVWPAGDLIVHLACWAQSKGLVQGEATS